MEGIESREAFDQEVDRRFLPSQLRLLKLAYRLAKYGHARQTRDDGSRYFDHPRTCAWYILQLGIDDAELVIAALLHDLMEDTFLLTWEDLEDIFGSRVTRLIRVVSKDPGDSLDTYYQRICQCEPGAWLIKGVDRLHNLRHIGGQKPARQLRKLQETSLYVMPILARLRDAEGVYQIPGTRLFDLLLAEVHTLQDHLSPHLGA